MIKTLLITSMISSPCYAADWQDISDWQLLAGSSTIHYSPTSVKRVSLPKEAANQDPHQNTEVWIETSRNGFHKEAALAIFDCAGKMLFSKTVTFDDDNHGSESINSENEIMKKGTDGLMTPIPPWAAIKGLEKVVCSTQVQ